MHNKSLNLTGAKDAAAKLARTLCEYKDIVMSILNTLHNKLNTKEPPKRRPALVNAALTSAFAYAVLAIGIIYFTYSADPEVIDSILLVKYSWVFCFVSAIACLSIAHYFYFNSKITTSISGGVTMLLFMQLLINASMFYMLFVYIHKATDNTHNNAFNADAQEYARPLI